MILCGMAVVRTPPDSDTGVPSPVVESACPLDCPDACTLHVTVHRGRIVEIDGSQKNPVTGGYICAKVRKFDERVYGPDRLQYPAIRVGPKPNTAANRSCRTRTAARTACSRRTISTRNCGDGLARRGWRERSALHR